MDDDIDYALFHDLEAYLFGCVGPKFRRTGAISPEDFYVILAWKANRSKNKGRDRLKILAGTFQEAVCSISCALFRAGSNKERLGELMTRWRFRLPMASAILAVLFPDDFTVYDVRVCDELGDYHGMANRVFSDPLWAEYDRFTKAVDAAVPHKLTLREKDHFLWGRSFRKAVVKDCAA